MADRQPSGIPTNKAQPIPASTRYIVCGNCSKTIVLTDLRLKTSSPRSPVATRPINLTICTGKGSLSPIFSRICACNSGLARGPRMVFTGSPGTRWIIEYSIETATTTINTPSRILLQKYIHMIFLDLFLGQVISLRTSSDLPESKYAPPSSRALVRIVDLADSYTKLQFHDIQRSNVIHTTNENHIDPATGDMLQVGK